LFSTSLSRNDGIALSSFDETQADDVGQFGLRGLHRPSDWSKISSQCIEQCNALVTKCSTGSTVSPIVLQHLDALSDTLCRVVDCAELCRNVHPDPDFRSAADYAFSEVGAYMQGLNAHAALYDALVKLEASDYELSAEERLMSASLRKDFEQGGIKLAAAERGTVVALNSRMHELGSQFTQNLQQNTLKEISFHPEALSPLPAALIRSLKRSRTDPGKVTIPMLPSAVSTVMQWVSNPAVEDKYMKQACAIPT